MPLEHEMNKQEHKLRRLLSIAFRKARCNLVDFRLNGNELIATLENAQGEQFVGCETDYTQWTDDQLVMRFYRFAVHYGQHSEYRPRENTIPRVQWSMYAGKQ